MTDTGIKLQALLGNVEKDCAKKGLTIQNTQNLLFSASEKNPKMRATTWICQIKQLQNFKYLEISLVYDQKYDTKIQRRIEIVNDT